MNDALKNSGDYFLGDRSYIFLINKKGTLDNAYEWCRDGVEPQIGKLQGIDIRYIEHWLPYFKENKAFVTPNVEKIRESRPEEYRILTEQDIHSMDGYEATKAIRALKRVDAESVPIIAMTADAFTDDIRKCLQEGMNGHLSKPVDPEILCRELSKAIASRMG